MNASCAHTAADSLSAGAVVRQKALLLANKLKKGFSDVDGVAEHVPLSTLDGCRELAVVFTGAQLILLITWP